MPKGEIEVLLHSFHLISGMEISLSNRKFQGLISFQHKGEGFCSLIHRSGACLRLCKDSDMHWCHKSRQTGISVRYACPFGITECILPILVGERVTGHIFCAMGVERTSGNEDEEIAARVAAVAPQLPREAVTEAIRALPHYDSTSMNAYYQLLQALVCKIELQSLPLDPSPTIGELAKRYIRENLSKSITLKQLAWQLHCSTVTLTQHFKAEFGITVTEYIRKKRIAEAERLLLESDKPLQEIAFLCGFENVEYFSRLFKKLHGIPPGKWRTRQTI